MNLLDFLEESCWIVGEEPWVWYTRVSKYMVPEQDFMEEAVLECGVD